MEYGSGEGTVAVEKEYLGGSVGACGWWGGGAHVEAVYEGGNLGGLAGEFIGCHCGEGDVVEVRRGKNKMEVEIDGELESLGG